MVLPLKKSIVEHLISAIHGSIDELVVDWEVQVSQDCLPAPARERATIYRWLDKGIPEKRDDLFSFACMLSCDPSAILDLETIFKTHSFSDIRTAFQLGLARKSPLRSMFDMFLMDPNWPDDRLSRKYYGKNWSQQKFSHSAENLLNRYAEIQLTQSKPLEFEKPVAYHFAYKRKNAPDLMWRPYGTVVRFGNSVRLYSESGAIQPAITEDFHTGVETFFGNGPADFKVVSIDEFTLDVVYPSNAQNASRFDG